MRTVESQLAEIRSRSLLRILREIGTAQQPETTSGGCPLVNFSSNDYLGLAADPILREAAKACIDEWGVGAGASRLICGNLGPPAAKVGVQGFEEKFHDVSYVVTPLQMCRLRSATYA